jgi:hypothetical protein
VSVAASGAVDLRQSIAGAAMVNVSAFGAIDLGITTDPDASAIDTEGWRVTVANLSGTDPATDDIVPEDERYVVVTSPGFDENGDPTTLTRNQVMSGRVDEIYPNNGTLTTDQVAISEFIYATDTVVGLTNNSTRAAPTPMAVWASKDRQLATGADIELDLAVAHAMARNGRPVAAVKFIVTDQSDNTSEVVVNTMTDTVWPNGQHVPVFRANVPLAPLTQGDTLTIDAVIYPWVGAAFQLSVDGDAYPSPNISTQRAHCDKDGTYGRLIAYVATGGNDGTGVVSTTATTAEAAPFATISAANIALKAANNTDFSRNNLSGCICRLETGDHEFAAPNPNGDDAADIPYLLEPADAADKATTSLTQSASHNFDSMPLYVEFSQLTLKKGPNNTVMLQNDLASTLEPMLIYDRCTFDLDGNLRRGSYNWDTGRNYLFGCDGDDIGVTLSFGSTCVPAAIGCEGTFVTGVIVYNLLGCIADGDIALQSEPPTAPPNGTLPAIVGRFHGWNFLTKRNNGALYKTDYVIPARGLAVIGNVFEYTAGVGGPVIQINADGNTTAAENILLQFNSLPGADRLNLLYNDAGGVAVPKHCYMLGNIWRNDNRKGDFFGVGPDAAHVGNQSEMHRVNHLWNAAITGSEGGPGPSRTSTFTGDILGLGNMVGRKPVNGTPISMDFADDQTSTGGGAGGGDYTPGPLYAGPLIPAGRTAYPFDQLGRTVPTNGTAVAGAVQKI